MKIAVVLFNLGGPDSLQAVKPFLFNLFNDPAIIGAPRPIRYLLARLISSRREKKAQGIYGQMGGRSPILPQTEAQAEALQAVLNASGTGEWRCFIAMRYWNPRAQAALQEVIKWGPDRVVLLPLYPQFSTTTTSSSFREWLALAEKARFNPPTTALCCYYASAGWIDALVARTRQAIEQQAIEQAGGKPMVLFSAHGLPQKIVDGGDPYQWQVEQTVARVRDALADLSFDFRICYQSRVGPLKWIGPSTEDCVMEAAKEKRRIVMVPVAFVSEHSETLVELDIEYRHLAQAHGAAAYVRAPTVQTHRDFIDGLARLAIEAGASESGMRSGPQNDTFINHECPGFDKCARRRARFAEAIGLRSDDAPPVPKSRLGSGVGSGGVDGIGDGPG